MSTPKRVLITFVGGTGGIGIARALKAAPEPVEIIGVDAEKFSLRRAVADEKFMVPRADEPDYLAVLRDVVQRTEPDLVWPTHDAEVAAVASDTELAARSFLPPHDVIALCQDKSQASATYSAAGVRIPDSMLIKDESDLRAAFAEFGDEIWVRMNRGAGGKGSTPVSDFNTATKWIDLHNGWGNFTAAPYIRGDRLNCEMVWHEGDLIAAQGNHYVMPELGSLTRSGITGVSRANRWCSDERLLEISEQAVRAVMPEPNGVFSVDTLRDSQGNFYVTEINVGRFSNGGFTHSLMHGVNISYEVLKLALGEETPTKFPLINPLPGNYLMLRGIDLVQFEVPESEVDAYEAEFAKRRGKTE